MRDMPEHGSDQEVLLLLPEGVPQLQLQGHAHQPVVAALPPERQGLS